MTDAKVLATITKLAKDFDVTSATKEELVYKITGCAKLVKAVAIGFIVLIAVIGIAVAVFMSSWLKYVILGALVFPLVGYLDACHKMNEFLHSTEETVDWYLLTMK